MSRFFLQKKNESSMRINKQTFFSITALLLSVIAVYQPSLSGHFIYDDFWSLEKLSVINGNITWESLSAYLISSDSGPIKRPISMLTFLIDAQDWPADAHAFRVTNLIIHLINGLLLFCLMFTVLKLKGSTQAVWMALFATLLWALHPFLVSTVAYVVQRMAMLPVFFALLSLLLYLKIRLKYQEHPPLKSFVYLSLVVYGLTFFATLSKENGLLILFYIPLFEYFICQQHLRLNPMRKSARWLFTVLPVVILSAAFLIKIPDFLEGYVLRDFSLYERLITEPRALVKYLYHWAVPSVMTEGVFTDVFEASSSLLNPISTLFSLLFIGAMIFTSVMLRNRWPLFGFAALFYCVAHLIESTVVPLQLYFEHRNYAAFLFLGLPLVVAIYDGIKIPRMALLVLTVISLFLMTQTFLRSTLWGDTVRLKVSALEAFPESVRARIGVVEMLENQANFQNGLLLLEQGIEMKASPALIAYKLKIKCHFDEVLQEENQQLIHALADQGLKHQDILPIGSLIQSLLNDKCAESGRNFQYTEDILTALSKQLNPDVTLGWSMYHYAKGRLAHARQNYPDGIVYFIKAFEMDKNYQMAIMAAAQLLNSREPELALKLLEVVSAAYDNDHYPDLRVGKEIDRFLKLTHEEIAAKHEDIDHNPGQE